MNASRESAGEFLLRIASPAALVQWLIAGISILLAALLGRVLRRRMAQRELQWHGANPLQ